MGIPKGTQYGKIFRMGSKGLPDLRSGRRGDLVVVTHIETPTKMTPEQEKLLRQFAETEHERGVHPESRGFWDKIREKLGG